MSASAHVYRVAPNNKSCLASQYRVVPSPHPPPVLDVRLLVLLVVLHGVQDLHILVPVGLGGGGGGQAYKGRGGGKQQQRRPAGMGGNKQVYVVPGAVPGMVPGIVPGGQLGGAATERRPGYLYHSMYGCRWVVVAGRHGRG